MLLPEFRDPALLRRALMHRSYLNEHPEEPEDNERLEFLGDAVLDFICGALLYRVFPNLNEGGLTRLRAALVRKEQLAQFALELGLNELIYLGRGENDTQNRQRPSLLCATFEAVLGAYYLDSGIEAAREWIEPLLHPAAAFILTAEADRDPKSLLQEWSQAALSLTPYYRLSAANGPDHSKAFTVEAVIGEEVYGVGSGPNKQAAEQAAAESALRQIRATH